MRASKQLCSGTPPDSDITNTHRIIRGDASEVVKRLEVIVNCVVTSPPYFNKREYGDSDSEIGQEKTVETFCTALASVFDSIPLHPLGSVWVNLGDKRHKNGSLLMVPEKFAIMMQDHGWLLVDNVIWAKILDDENGDTEGGCMIEPAPYRLNGNGYENVYHFVKTRKAQEAWSDTCAVRIPRAGLPTQRYLPENLMKVATSVDGRCLHNVWRLPMGQTRDSHYAVFPLSLPERPIAMTCPMDVCAKCGAPYSREIEMVEYEEKRGNKRAIGKYTSIKDADDVKESGRMDSGRKYVPRKPKTNGWSVECSCNTIETRPGIVLDPFCGTATVGEAALKLGRSFIGIDLYEKYCTIAEKRCKEAERFLKAQCLNPRMLRH
jgi:site-specific DNA-methyltransferase (adenine-specific)